MNANIARRMRPKPPVEPIKKWKLVRGDEVKVISGKEKGKTGIISRVNRKRNTVFLEGLNLVKKHVKSNEDFKGGIFTKEAPIHYSNVSLIDPVTKKATKIAWKFKESGERVRVAKKSGATIPKPAILVAYQEERKKRIDNPDKDTPSSAVLKRTFTLPTLADLD